jgi:hypothetical protein
MTPIVAIMLPLRGEMQRKLMLAAIHNRLTNSGYGQGLHQLIETQKAKTGRVRVIILSTSMES